MLTSAVVEVSPCSHYLACVLVLLGTAVAARARSWPVTVLAPGLALLLSSYVRPELAVSFLCFCLASWPPRSSGRLRSPRSCDGGSMRVTLPDAE